MIGIRGIAGLRSGNTTSSEHEEEENGKSLVVREYSTDGLRLTIRTTNKFLDDKAFSIAPGSMMASEGVLLNKADLAERHQSLDAGELLRDMQAAIGEDFFKELRGTFYVVSFNAKEQRLIVATDHTASRPLYYVASDERLLFSSNLFDLAKMMRQEGMEVKIDRGGAYCMLAFGLFPPSRTYLDGVHRLAPGHYLAWDKGQTSVREYYALSNTPNDLNEEENIEAIDKAFRRSVRRILAKNAEYGYSNVMPLSAGLDSRMTTWVAHEISDAPIVNYTYSQSGYYDESEPREIAAALGNKWVFCEFNKGEFLYSLDEVVGENSGVVDYGSSAQTMYGLKHVEEERLGVVAAGMAGDILRLSLNSVSDTEPCNSFKDASSTWLARKLADKIPTEDIMAFPCREIQNMHLYNLSHHTMTPIAVRGLAEVYSPYTDPDFMDAVLSVPFEQRKNHELNDRWILSKHPGAAKWPHNGVRTIGEKQHFVNIAGRSIELKTLPQRAWMFFAKKTGLKNYDRLENGQSMSPEDSWLEDNAELRAFFEEKFTTRIDVVKDPTLKADIREAFEKGTSIEKENALTLLASLQRLKDCR